MKPINPFLIASLTLTIAVSLSAEAQMSLPKAGLRADVQKKLEATTLVLNAPASWCTVSPITPDGYLLTALHCVRDCLIKAGAAEEGAVPNFGLQDLFLVKNPTRVNVVCADQSVPALGAKSVTVVATGRALSSFSAEFFGSFSGLHQELQERGLSSRGNDFALLKIDTKKPLPCLSLQLSPMVAGSKIFGIGFPKPQQQTQSLTLQASPGLRYASASQSQFYQASPQSERAYVESLYNDTAVIYSNAVSQFGQSGGPVVNEAGELVGVISGYSIVPRKNRGEIHELVGAAASAFSTQLPPAVIQASTLCR